MIQQNVLFGSLLSNACFGLFNHEKKEISVVFQSKHREIVVLLYLVFKNLTFLPIHKSRSESFNEFTFKKSKILNFSFQTKEYQLFLMYWKLWTSEGPDFRKIIPKNIQDFLNSESLAVWYMMSGYPDGNGYAFRVHHYPKDEILLLQRALEENFNLKISILVDRICLINQTELLKLYIHSDSRILFSQLIQPFMLKTKISKMNGVVSKTDFFIKQNYYVNNKLIQGDFVIPCDDTKHVNFYSDMNILKEQSKTDD